MKNSILTSTQNNRPILPDSLRYIRSDVPHKITEAEVNAIFNSEV